MNPQVENSQNQNETVSLTQSETPKKTNQERIEAGEPHIKYKEQLIFTKNWPGKNCRKCLSTGYVGVLLKGDRKALTLGRNDKCPCGSDKKYKKCCLELVARMRMSGSSILTCSCVGKGAELAENPDLDKLRAQMTKVMG